MLKTKYYYTFKDIERLINFDLTFADVIGLGFNKEYTSPTGLEDIWAIVKTKYYNWFFFVSTEQLTFNNTEKVSKRSTKLYDLARRLIAWVDSDYNKYHTLLTYYNALKDKLVDKIESSQTVDNSHNDYDDDTPQHKIVSGVDLFDKSHASYYKYGDSHQESSASADTIYNIEKLDKLYTLYHDVESEWAESIERFIYFYELED